MTINRTFRRIGQGFCGSVWSAGYGLETDRPEVECAVKREDGGLWRSLHNDFTERIQPFPEAVRRSIIDLYRPNRAKQTIKDSTSDQDCLIRPYLGRRRRGNPNSTFQPFTLRNYPLHLDQIEDLSLDSLSMAGTMAETLANIYWRAQVDANDVEFVLAPPRETTHSHIMKSPTLGDYVIWILDFDCCKHMPLDEVGVEQAVAAFYKNDPYYPRPERGNPNDQQLWEAFKIRLIEASRAIIAQNSLEAHLPELWIDLVEQRAEESSHYRGYMMRRIVGMRVKMYKAWH
ncbi:MAG: hypothetical protein Q9194_005496 [Teloschistes cf. exilis]